MNQAQRVYIRKRIEGITSVKLTEARVKFTTVAVTQTNQERVQLIRSGKVKLKTDTEIRAIMGAYNTSISTIFDFSKYETKGFTDQDKLNKYKKKITAKANEINDSVMLGDAKEALQMIKDFENFNG